MKASDDASTCNTHSNENTMTKTGDRCIKKERQHSSFEWIHLIATICVPIIIAIYTIIDNNKKESIAAAGRHKDMEIANSSQLAELEIAQANRLHEIAIAEQNRQKDRELAIDQQRENILAQYQIFMANLLIENGMVLNKTPTARAVALSMTLTTLSQLDARRKGIIIRSLYQTKLITLHKNSQPLDTAVLQLGDVHLSDITFGPSRDSPAERPWYRCIDWYYLWLPGAILTNASFRHTCLNCATLSSTSMDSVDLSFVRSMDINCFGEALEGQVTFSGSSLINSSFYKTQFRFTSFDGADLTFANMRYFFCMECTFRSAILFQADLSFSCIFPTFIFHPGRLDFNLTNLRQAVMHSANFRSTSFFQSDWSNAQASHISLHNSTFINVTMEHCSLTESNIHLSLFQNASLFSIDLSNAKLDNVIFIDSYMHNANMSSMQCNNCNFTNVKLQGAVFKNASLRNSIFLNCDVEMSQLEQAIDLSGLIFSNGIVVKSNG